MEIISAKLIKQRDRQEELKAARATRAITRASAKKGKCRK